MAGVLRPLLLAGVMVNLAFPGPMPAVAEEPTRAIRLNSVGYLPGAAKLASVARGVGAEEGATEAKRFVVRRVADGAVVLEGDLSTPKKNADTEEWLATADFSAVDQPGEYVLAVDGLGESGPFRIDGDLYRDPFRLATRAMYLWRCGAAVEGEHGGDRYEHAACHLNDAYLDFVGGGHERLHATGGWHDAGDYNKYVVNAGATVGVMLRAWEDFGTQIERVPLEIPEQGGPLPEFLAEIKWELDWLHTMQADDGSVYHKLSTQEFGPLELPEKETTPRFVTPWSSAATADFVAMMAQASRHFAPYDRAYADKCLAAAKRSYAFLTAHPEERPADHAGFKTGGYDSPDDDDRLWAAAELWEATGDAAALADLETRIVASPGVDVDWDWPNLKTLGLLTYLFSERDGRNAELVAQVRAGLIAAADEIVATGAADGYGRPLGSRYYWGCNGSVARQSLVLQGAYRLTAEEAYRWSMLDGLNHLLGRNYYGRSFITGLGERPPGFPHDRRSEGDDVDAPWPGYLIGGPHPRATSWNDVAEDYRTNEIAINWNGALIYALAAFLDAPTGAAE